MANVPTLAKPLVGDVLLIYLAVSDYSTSSVLVKEEDGVQRPVYYTSRSFTGAEVRYPIAEKWAMALVVAARKLRPYFQAHKIVVVTNQPLRQILHKPDISGRLVKWSVELSEFDISYQPRSAIKAQALVDFINDCSDGNEGMDAGQEIKEAEKNNDIWELNVDGAANPEGSGGGIVLVSPDQEEVCYALKYQFHPTNNEAEYEALIAGLKLARALGVRHLNVKSDSQLVVNHLNGTFQAKSENMSKYLSKALQLWGNFDQATMEQVPMGENYRADYIARLAAAECPKFPRGIPLESVSKPCISDPEMEVCVVEDEKSWMMPIMRYIEFGEQPRDKAEARRLRCKAIRYSIIEGVLYRRGYTLPYLRCLGSVEANYVMREVHEGICGNHGGGRALAHKIIRQGYFWPTVHEDAHELVRRCDECQKFAVIARQPPENMMTMGSTWPFAQWGVDLIGPMPTGRGQMKYAVVAIDYFTKWIEVEPLQTITEKRTTDFIWRNVICRYGLPQAIITDNGTQFNNENFKKFCSQLGIELRFISPAHPKANGQVEAANKTIKQLLKKRLGEKKGAWVDELSGVLWAYRTTVKTSTGETPFSLAFGHEAVIPAEVGIETHRTKYYDETVNMEHMLLDLDLLDEKREAARGRAAIYQQKVAKFYNKNVRLRQFQEGDLVLRKVNQSTKKPADGVLGPSWEGPYRVLHAFGNGAYKLGYPNGRVVGKAWNAEHLRKYYQ